jgi:hypothetical protein
MYLLTMNSHKNALMIYNVIVVISLPEPLNVSFNDNKLAFI